MIMHVRCTLRSVVMFFFAFLCLTVTARGESPFDDNSSAKIWTPTLSIPGMRVDGESTAHLASGIEAIHPKSRITGGFIQPCESDNERSSASWTQFLTPLQAVGVDTVIMQYNQADGTNYSEATEGLLTAADSLGMHIFIGTALNEKGWYTNKLAPWFLAKESVIVADYTTILVNQFKDHPSFVGVYIPYEDNTLSVPGAMGDFYGRIADAVRAAKPELKVMISPYTTPRPGVALSLPKFALQAYFTTMLKHAKVDICAWQDGVGGTRSQIDRVAHDLGAISKACKLLKISLWANLEVFRRTTPLSEDFSAEATDISTLLRQISVEAPYAEKLICFDFNHYLSPDAADPTAGKLYQDYAEYLQTP
ncbi:MAG: DUF4434 domain-containing protein [Candidatus Ozemobacteraceae bacterium]